MKSATAGIQAHELAVFGLTEAETNTLVAVLNEGPASVSAIARAAGEPRKTVHYVLPRLNDRGFVEPIEHAYKSLWQAKSVTELRQQVRDAVNALDRIAGDVDEHVQAPAQTNGSTALNTAQLFTGVYAGMAAWEAFQESVAADEEVFWLIHGDGAARYFTGADDIPVYQFYDACRSSGRSITCVMGVATISMLEVSHVKHVARYIDGAVHNRVTADAYTDMRHDILVSRHAVAVIDPAAGTLALYTDGALVAGYMHAFRALMDVSEPVDIEQHLRETVANRGRNEYNGA
jgi:predicted transcriptional regulator